jgi:hypothetical protein
LEAQKENDEDEVFLLLRFSYSFLILSSFLGAISARRILTFIMTHLRSTFLGLAKSLKQKPLIIPHHFDEQTGSFLDLVTSWFDTAYVGKNGAGYFAVTLSPVLKPYLLQVKREFFRFRLYQVMQLRSGYAIRLYQWAKRWQYRKSIEISVQDLRTVLGANNPAGSSESRGNLAEYADFKRRAIKPAIDEINKKTDLSLGFRELKRPGSKAIDRLVFSIKSEPAPELEVLQPPSSSASTGVYGF